MAEPSLRRTLAPWLRLLGRRRRRLQLGALLLLATVASAIGLLALSGWFITATALTGMLLAAGVAASLDVYVPGGGIRFFAVARTVARYLERLYNHDSVLRLLADLRARLFSVLAGLDGQTLARRRASEWLNRLTADIDTLDGLYLRLLAPPVVALLAILGVAGFLALFAPMIGAWVALPLLLTWCWLVVGQARWGLAPSRRRVASLDRLRGQAVETLQGLPEWIAYDSLGSQRARLAAEESALYADQWRLGVRSAFGNALVGLVVGGTAVLALWLAASAYYTGQLSGPVMVMMPLALLAMGEALAALPASFTQFGASLAAADRLNALEAAPRAPLGGMGTLPAGVPELALEAVTLHYPGALTPALSQVSLRLAPGERIALLGASGAGKSSLAALVAGQLTATAGEVSVAGRSLAELMPAAWREALAWQTQRLELFDDSLAANLRLAAPEADETALWRVLALVELDDWAAGLPQGLQTRVGESGGLLSGGQARRLSLARVLLRERARVVILDEPFAGVDAAMAARIAARLDAWLDGRSLLYLIHQWQDAAPLPGIERSYRLVEGRLESV
ncbi:thiol reductant ABC exporter subunit CydC [Halomonas sp. 328]|uniref:thiol reductant ABC exporter subunit CydC n=1 Tax=Halomonas sp. 328 TaxID=2776704 RepID=UPI0018A78970|nr:thiol reductant ABC exporter subunit CydC [Halomonas sp. 328]MBF8222128.1 thiol reductant ABC exporter subunit CydC [Halomonas sp. 328]